jgi:molybdate transport system regulatory protein
LPDFSQGLSCQQGEATIISLMHDDNKGSTTQPAAKLTLRLYHHDEIAMGPGKADLLAAIQRTGSISKAGRSMSMSYRRAWMLVDVMNRCFAQPLVHTAKGGKDGGGAALTPFGLEVLENYNKMRNAADHAVQAYLPLFSGLMKVAQEVD